MKHFGTVKSFDTIKGLALLCHGIGPNDMAKVGPDDFGYALGMAFQMADDVKGTFWTSTESGKTEAGDVRKLALDIRGRMPAGRPSVVAIIAGWPAGRSRSSAGTRPTGSAGVAGASPPGRACPLARKSPSRNPRRPPLPPPPLPPPRSTSAFAHDAHSRKHIVRRMHDPVPDVLIESASGYRHDLYFS